MYIILTKIHNNNDNIPEHHKGKIKCVTFLFFKNNNNK